MQFQPGTSYPIDTLPDDLHDKTIPNSVRWAIRDALFWNDCQGWWTAHVADERRALDFGTSIARFWQPLPPDPMTREQILTERGMVACPACDHAFDRDKPHDCRPSEDIIEQRRLQAVYVAPDRDPA